MIGDTRVVVLSDRAIPPLEEGVFGRFFVRKADIPLSLTEQNNYTNILFGRSRTASTLAGSTTQENPLQEH